MPQSPEALSRLAIPQGRLHTRSINTISLIQRTRCCSCRPASPHTSVARYAGSTGKESVVVVADAVANQQAVVVESPLHKQQHCPREESVPSATLPLRDNQNSWEGARIGKRDFPPRRRRKRGSGWIAAVARCCMSDTISTSLHVMRICRLIPGLAAGKQYSNAQDRSCTVQRQMHLPPQSRSASRCRAAISVSARCAPAAQCQHPEPPPRRLQCHTRVQVGARLINGGHQLCTQLSRAPMRQRAIVHWQLAIRAGLTITHPRRCLAGCCRGPAG